MSGKLVGSVILILAAIAGGRDILFAGLRLL